MHEANFELANNETSTVNFELLPKKTSTVDFNFVENQTATVNFELQEQITATADFDFSNRENLEASFKINVIPSKISQLVNDVGYITIEDIPDIDLSNYATKEELNQKQDIISDLATIRENALLAVTAIQPSDLAIVATTGDFYDLTNVPTIPTMTSQLTNNSDFTTKSYVDNLVGNIETLLANINSGS